MRGRFYSPAWHRFMNSDQGVDPNSLNQVAYVVGNPLMHTDPTGMMDPDAGYQDRDRREFDKAVERDRDQASCTPADGKTGWDRFKEAFQKFNNRLNGLGSITDAEVPAALEAMAVRDPYGYMSYMAARDPRLMNLAMTGCGLSIQGGPPNPFGKAGGPAHQAMIDKVEAEIEARGLKAVRELKVKTPGGFKETRFVDIAGVNSANKVQELHQIGRQTKAGMAVAREMRAISDIMREYKDMCVNFHPYN